MSAAAANIKPRGAFRVFSNFRLFAIIGAVGLVGGYALSVSGGGAVVTHGGAGGGDRGGVRGEGVVRRTPEPPDGESAPLRTVQQYTAPPGVLIQPAKSYTATITTERGEIVVELLPEAAPQAVNNFVFLAREGFYNGVGFHRVIPGFVAQGGDPTGTGLGGPGYELPFEPSTAAFEAGMLAMARPSEAGAPNNGSQFFFALVRQPALDGESTVFGRVVSGLDVLERLEPRNPDAGEEAVESSVIRSITIDER
ncbi:MAG: peptidylprolyl isomerase [Dehalococcoidia bacterium]